jgi:hypothetical protein
MQSDITLKVREIIAGHCNILRLTPITRPIQR